MQTIDKGSVAVTCSADGKTVYYFGPKQYVKLFEAESYLGSLSVP